MNPTTSIMPYLVSAMIAVLSAAALPDAAVTQPPGGANTVRHVDPSVRGTATPPSPATRPAAS
jgi:hypothetical protein